MTPLIHNPSGVVRGDAGGDGASGQHRHVYEGASDAITLSDAEPVAVPSVKKRRKRRRDKAKALVKKDCQQIGLEGAALSKPKNNTKSYDNSRFLKTNLENAVPQNTKNDDKARNATGKARYQGQQRKSPLYAALDLGTNNCRLLIASPTKPGHFRVIDAFSRIVRLGEGLGRTGALNEKAMDRAIEALKVCRLKLDQRQIKRHRLIATEACRSAANGKKFIARVYEETGLNLEIIDRETEARLAVSGCGTLVERDTDAIVLFDIGGGSSEIVLIDRSKKRSPRLAEHIIAWTSLPVGVITLAERFGGENVTADDFVQMKNYVRTLLQGFKERHKLDDLVKSPHFHLLGTSGTVTTLAGIHLELVKYDRRQIDGIWMNSEDVTQMTNRLLSWDLAQRVANPCIGQDRADLVLAGCAILEVIREVWPSDRIRVADRGLREGILTELMSRDGVWRRTRRFGSHLRRQAKQVGSDHL